MEQRDAKMIVDLVLDEKRRQSCKSCQGYFMLLLCKILYLVIMRGSYRTICHDSVSVSLADHHEGECFEVCQAA